MRPSLTIAARFAIVTSVLLFLGNTPLNARGVRDWTYKDLVDASDLVVVVEPIKNENNAEQWEWIPKFAQGMTTTFKVLCLLKGEDPNNDAIRVKHFVYKNVWPGNGGSMINFQVAPLNIRATFRQNGKSEDWNFENLHPTWLAFLKKASDGTFSPTSGEIDPAFSFRELHQASMFDPTHGVIH